MTGFKLKNLKKKKEKTKYDTY